MRWKFVQEGTSYDYCFLIAYRLATSFEKRMKQDQRRVENTVELNTPSEVEKDFSDFFDGDRIDACEIIESMLCPEGEIDVEIYYPRLACLIFVVIPFAVTNTLIHSQAQSQPQQESNQISLLELSCLKISRFLSVRNDLTKKIGAPLFTCRKISDDIKVAEGETPLINQRCVVCKFSCDLCNTT